MIKHIVMWKLKATDPGAKKAAAIELKEALEGLKGKVPQVRSLEVGINFNPADTASDVSLYTVFDSQADLDLYQKHPDHLKVVEVVKRLTSERRVSDYETQG
ncbi:MAG TPA: Dabb family protein [bacterium]|nr:Dabb family protein [bacterium]